jgi:predicted component of type VI protein secretion system
VADSLMIKDYDYLKPQNKNETAQQLIQRYENNLKLSMEKHLMPKLYEDDRYIKKMAKYHASEMGPLTASFLRQGYNFLDKKLIIHCNFEFIQC